MRRSRPVWRTDCRRSTSHRIRASCCTCSRARFGQSGFSKSGRSADTARSGSRARSHRADRLITLEYEPKHAEVARANIERAGLARGGGDPDRQGDRHAAEDSRGRRRAVRPRVHRRRQDRGMRTISRWAMKLTHVGRLIIVDNVVRKGAGDRRGRRRERSGRAPGARGDGESRG